MSVLHEMYALLQECGDDVKCGCGCGAEPKSGKKVLDEKPKKAKSEDAEVEDASLEERRRKIGVKAFKKIRELRAVRKGKGSKVSKVKTPKAAVRGRPTYNRHR